MYGSSFCIRTDRPRFSSSMPIEALVRPLPSELTTPPVTKMYLVMNDGPSWYVLRGFSLLPKSVTLVCTAKTRPHRGRLQFFIRLLLYSSAGGAGVAAPGKWRGKVVTGER